MGKLSVKFPAVPAVLAVRFAVLPEPAALALAFAEHELPPQEPLMALTRLVTSLLVLESITTQSFTPAQLFVPLFPPDAEFPAPLTVQVSAKSPATPGFRAVRLTTPPDALALALELAEQAFPPQEPLMAFLRLLASLLVLESSTRQLFTPAQLFVPLLPPETEFPALLTGKLSAKSPADPAVIAVRVTPPPPVAAVALVLAEQELPPHDPLIAPARFREFWFVLLPIETHRLNPVQDDSQT